MEYSSFRECKCFVERDKESTIENTMSRTNRGDSQINEEDIDELLAKEKVMWRQSSKAEWLKARDKNTSFFFIFFKSFS